MIMSHRAPSLLLSHLNFCFLIWAEGEASFFLCSWVKYVLNTSYVMIQKILLNPSCKWIISWFQRRKEPVWTANGQGGIFKRWISLTSAGRSKVLLRNAYKKMKELDDLLKTKDRAHEMSVWEVKEAWKNLQWGPPSSLKICLAEFRLHKIKGKSCSKWSMSGRQGGER